MNDPQTTPMTETTLREGVDMDDIARFIEAAIALRINANEGKAISDFFRSVYDVPRKEPRRGPTHA